MSTEKKHIYFLGIGGTLMGSLAQLAKEKGYRVSGSDVKASDITANLARLGGTIHIGHRQEQVADADVVVVRGVDDDLLSKLRVPTRKQPENVGRGGSAVQLVGINSMQLGDPELAQLLDQAQLRQLTLQPGRGLLVLEVGLGHEPLHAASLDGPYASGLALDEEPLLCRVVAVDHDAGGLAGAAELLVGG